MLLRIFWRRFSKTLLAAERSRPSRPDPYKFVRACPGFLPTAGFRGANPQESRWRAPLLRAGQRQTLELPQSRILRPYRQSSGHNVVGRAKVPLRRECVRQGTETTLANPILLPEHANARLTSTPPATLIGSIEGRRRHRGAQLRFEEFVAES